MRVLLLLFLLTGCSVTRFYQGPAVSAELQNNEKNLSIVVASVEADFAMKSTFMGQFQQKGKDPFIKENLDQKLVELREKKEILVTKTQELLKTNHQLLKQVSTKSKIKEGDPVFRNLEKFADHKDEALTELLEHFAAYKKTSEEFEKLAFFTKMVQR